MDKKLDIKWYPCIDSTNMQAHRELGEAGEGTVWVADYQTAGRGQRGNSWESGDGQNLLFTVLLRPEFLNVQKQFAISQIVALAVVKYLETKGLHPKIKWPNDIYINDRKICGILIEHSVSSANLSASIVGIGINVNQLHFCSDAPNPTSILLAINNLEPGNIPDNIGLTNLERRDELVCVLQQIFSLYEYISDAEGLEHINAEYHSYLYRLGEFHEFLEVTANGNLKFEAKIVGINSYGCLVLEKRDGSSSEYAFQQIRYII